MRWDVVVTLIGPNARKRNGEGWELRGRESAQKKLALHVTSQASGTKSFVPFVPLIRSTLITKLHSLQLSPGILNKRQA
jgi:hypothetical protein